MIIQIIDDLDITLALQGHDHVISRTKSLNFILEIKVSQMRRLTNRKLLLEKTRPNTIKKPSRAMLIQPNKDVIKAYDGHYGKSLEHFYEVRPDLERMTQEDLDYYNNLFSFGDNRKKMTYLQTCTPTIVTPLIKTLPFIM